MFAISAVDGHFSGEVDELAGAGVGDDGDAELRSAARHGPGVLEDEGSGVAVKGAGDDFKGDVASRALDGCSGGEHGAFADGFEVAVELLVEKETAEGVASGSGVRGLRERLYFKDSFGIGQHVDPFEYRGGLFLRLSYNWQA